MATVAEIDAAIDDIRENGQSFSMGDITYTAANLSQLMALRETLKREESAESGSRPVFRAFKMSSAGY